MQKILYILFPFLLALATPSFSSTRKRFRERQRYGQYQQPTNNQSLEDKEGKSSNTIFKSTVTYCSIGLVAVTAITCFFLFDVWVLDAKIFKFAASRMNPSHMTSTVAMLWSLIQFVGALVVPGFTIGALIGIPVVYFIYSNDSDDNFNDENRYNYSKKRSHRY